MLNASGLIPSEVLTFPFNLSTFVGEESYSLPVVILKLLGQVGSQKGPQSITSYVSDYPSIPPVDLPQSLLQLKPVDKDFKKKTPPEDEVATGLRKELAARHRALNSPPGSPSNEKEN